MKNVPMSDIAETIIKSYDKKEQIVGDMSIFSVVCDEEGYHLFKLGFELFRREELHDFVTHTFFALANEKVEWKDIVDCNEVINALEIYITHNL